MGLFDFLKKTPGQPAAAPAGTPATPAATPAATPVATPAPTPAAPSAAAATGGTPAADSIEATDAFGRRVRLSREQYRKEVLPELLKAHGSDPERLTAIILQGLRDGLAKELIAAANRLTVIDKDPERCLSVLAVVQRDSGDLDAAEFTLRELLQKRPQSPNARVGLAMLQDQRGDLAASEKLLWEALQIDPNHADAVHGYLQLRHRLVGDAGQRAELDKLCALPGSWRPQLWLARLHLLEQDMAAAAAVYRALFATAGGESDALVMAAGDLAHAGQHALVDELVAPRFLPGRHHPHAGLTLLHHFVATKQHQKGSELLHQMHLHYGHMVGEQLQGFTAEFDRQRLAALPPPPPLPPNARIGLYRLDRPVWYAGLEDPQWLLPPKDQHSKQVLVMALAVDGQPSLPPGREDELGRLTRSVPLFLAEQIWLSTPHRGTATLPMAEVGGWAVMGRPWPEEQLCSQLGDQERQQTILVTGVLRVDGEQRRIDLWAYDCATRQRIGHAAAEGTSADVGRMLLQLMAELWPVLGGPAQHKPPVGDEVFWGRYLDGLGQHAALVVTMAGGMPKDRLYGERYIVQWLQSLALQEPRWQPAFWLYASGLCVLQQLGSPVPKEHARVVAEMFRQSPPNSAFALLAVRPLRAVGLDNFWQQRRPELMQAAGGHQPYQAWLQRAEKTGA
jgi:Flp pilus assembly protein TadD